MSLTHDEAFEIVYIIQSNYPNFYARQTDLQADIMIRSWANMFADYDYHVVSAALRQIMLSKPNFPPTPAEVNAKIHEALNPSEQVLKGEEAWGEVQRLIRTYGTYLFPEQRQKLDAELNKDQVLFSAIRACGGLETIRMCELDNLNTLRAQFIRIYEAYSQRRYEKLLLPESMKAELRQISQENVPVIEQKPDIEPLLEPEYCQMPQSVKETLNNILGRVSNA